MSRLEWADRRKAVPTIGRHRAIASMEGGDPNPKAAQQRIEVRGTPEGGKRLEVGGRRWEVKQLKIIFIQSGS